MDSIDVIVDLFFSNSFEHIAVLWLCANWLAMSNSCHNPFIYGFCSVRITFFLNLSDRNQCDFYFQAKFNREFRKLLSCFPCIDDPDLEGNSANKNRRIVATSVLPKTRQLQPSSSSKTAATINSTAVVPQLRRTNCQRRSPTASPAGSVRKQRSTDKNRQHEKRFLFFPNYKSNRHKLFGGCSSNNNYYSSKMDRSITNCEKFLLDQELTNSSRESDLLLIRAREATHLI